MRRIVLLAILAAGLWAAAYLGLSPAKLVPSEGGLTLAGEFFQGAFSPALISESGTGRSLLGNVLEGLWATVLFAAAGMSLALVLGVVLGFFASSAWWSGDAAGGQGPVARVLRRSVWPAVYAVARVVATFLRSIHELLWALLFLSAFGLSNFSAVVAIALPYGGTLAKVFSEMVDEAPRESALALRGAGASPLQVFVFGLLPRALPDMAAYAFYRFECALRSSAILGFFGYPTLGYFLAASFENVYFREVWTYLYALFLLVALVDWWSGALRRRLVVA
jgi:phosphonate transport system permease protein